MNIIITGTSRGIGLELTKQALAKGHHVLGVARRPEDSPELQKLRGEGGKTLEIVAADVSQPEAAERIASAVAAWPTVDLLINNAGVYREGIGNDDFMASFQVNAVAPFLITRALFPKLKASANPQAVQITSLMGSIGDNESGGSYAYRASKAALNMITKTLAQDERWLTTIVVHPGWVQTRMGGASAPTPVVESATGIWRVIERLKKSDSGAFYDYQGERLAW